MAKLSVQAGSTGVSVNLFIQSSTATDGSGMGGLVFNAAGLTAYSIRQRTTATPITLATSTVGNPWVSGGFIEIDSTHAKGGYNFDIPNAVIGTGSPFATVALQGATAMAPLWLEIELTAWNNQDATAGGINNLSATGTLGSVLSLRTTATVQLQAGTHTAAVIPIVQTASALIQDLGTSTVVLNAGVHTGAIIPQVQTASNVLLSVNVGTASNVRTVDTVRTSTVSDFTAAALARYFDLDAGTYGTSSAQSVVKQIADNAGAAATPAQIATAIWAKFGTGTVMLLSGTHSGAVIPVVQTASNALTLNGAATVQLGTGTHTNAVIPTVNAVQTATSLTLGALNQIADNNLTRAWDAITETATNRNSLQAQRMLRNKWFVGTGTLYVKKEDDATDSWTAVVSSTASAQPVTGIDPA